MTTACMKPEFRRTTALGDGEEIGSATVDTTDNLLEKVGSDLHLKTP